MSDPNLARAKQAFDDLSADPKARELARDREMWHYLHDRELVLEREAGEAKGRAQGEAQGLVSAVRTACELLGVEITDAREARLARASKAGLEALIESPKRDRCWVE